MPEKKPRILIIEDDSAAAFAYDRFLVNAGFETKACTTLAEASGLIESNSFEAVILDLRLPDGIALDWIPTLKKAHPLTQVIVITGMSDIPTAIKATKNGAEYFLTKPVEIQDLRAAVDKCLELEALRRRDLVQQRLAKRDEPFFGESRAMVDVMDYARVAAENDSVILLLGETGVGKGVLARWIHNNSQRKSEPFIELNCSSIKGELLRSELYGHAKGSFTSAIKDREGLIEVANKGTLFLDEIGDMDLEVQSQLLKTIEEKSFRRIGENQVRHSDFRLICATNRDLLKGTDEKTFRKDLYYRICVFPITIPPLHERADDIPDLAAYLLAGLGCSAPPLSAEVLSLLKAYSWPGNIRELRNMLERAILLSRGAPLSIRHFPGMALPVPEQAPEQIQAQVSDRLFNQVSKLPGEKDDFGDSFLLTDIENAHIMKVLRNFNGDKAKASEALGISLSSLYRKLQSMVGSGG